jgi:uncharacterized protein YbjT (DUF2867 family)
MMIKSGMIVTDASGGTGSIVAAEPLESGHPVRISVRREDDRRS